jgi:peptidoglycan/LPS O-acetylase OafA/YrhL
MLSYQLALSLFLGAYLAPQWVTRFRWLDRLADISYPLYALHGALGYATALVINAATGQLYLSMVGAILAMLVLAAVMHRLVELPTQACGKWLSQRWLAWKASMAEARPDSEPSPLVLRKAA